MKNAKNAGADPQAAVLAKISNMSDAHRHVCMRLHEVIMKAYHTLCPRLWYGMPGYAKSKDSAVICFFRSDKYITFGLTESAHFEPEENSATQLMGCAWFMA